MNGESELDRVRQIERAGNPVGVRNLRPAIAMVCSFPPPIHGGALVSKRLRDRFVQNGFDILTIDTSPQSLRRGYAYYAARLVRLCQIWRLFSLRPHARIYCYVNGGWGAMIDVIVAAIARMIGAELWLHHHSFSYLDQISTLHRIAFALNKGRSNHLVLCNGMKKMLTASYGAHPDHVHVLSNVNFVDTVANISPQRVSGSTTIGFLSNISEEKGIADFLKLSDRLRDLPVLFEIAGPIADERYSWISDLGRQPEKRVRWIGPMDERGKAEFLSRIDILVFPTRYRHEAEPLVIYEAMASGVAVVAYDRGCIREMIDAPHLIAGSFDELEAATRSLAAKLPDRAKISEIYQRRRERSRGQMSIMEMA